MSLSDAKVRNAKPQTKPYKISDGDGLFLVVFPSGSKYWRMKYFFADKEKLLALGVYPDVTLSDARERRTQARKTLAAGNDPSVNKKEIKRLAVLKAENDFEAVAREWHEKRKHEWAEDSAKLVMARLERHIFPNSAKGRLPTSPRLRFSPHFASSKAAALWTRRSGSCRYAGKSSCMPLPRVAPSEIRFPICAVR